jgi:L-fuconolactonase
VDRCFCGGDWPVLLLAGNYVDTWKAYTTVLSELLDEKDQDKVLRSNAIEFYRL